MGDLHVKIAELTKSHPMLNEDKLQWQIRGIERMTAFYRDKQPEAPEKQAQLFAGFVSALVYASTVIRMYRKLTSRLAELAEEVDDETRADCES